MKPKAWLRGSLLIFPWLAAQAGAPLRSEDAELIAVGDCEAEALLDRSREGHPRQRSLAGGLSCALGPRSELGLAWQREQAEGTSSERLQLAGKQLLAEVGDSRLALAWSLDALRQRGLHFDGSSLLLVASQGLGSWRLHANLGWRHSRLAAQGLGVWAGAAEWTLFEGLELLAEWQGEQGHRPEAAWGLRWTPAENCSLGLLLVRPREPAVNRQLRASATLSF